MVAPGGRAVAVCVLVVFVADASFVAADEPLRVSTERNIERRYRSGLGLLVSGVALSVAGAAMLAAYPGCHGAGLTASEQSCIGLLPAGGVLAGVGLPLLTAGAVLTSDEARERRRLRGPIDPSDATAGRLLLLTHAELDQEMRRSAGLAIGGGVGHVLSIGTVVTGMLLSVFARQLSGIDAHPSDAATRQRDAFSDAGVSLMIIGGIAFGPTAALSLSGLTRWLRLRRAGQGPLTDTDLLARQASTRRRLLGGGISAVLCLALVAGGAGLLVDGGPRTDGGTLLQPADQGEEAAGVTLMTIASAGFVASVAVFADGMARRRRLGGAGGNSAAVHAWSVLPWATAHGAGLRLAATF